MPEGVDLDISQSHLEGIVTKAIIESITPEARDKLLAGVVNHLMGQIPASDQNRWTTDKRTRLLISFDNAVANVAERVVRQQLEEDPRLRESIQAMIDPLVAGIISEDYNDIIKRAMGRALVEAIRNPEKD